MLYKYAVRDRCVMVHMIAIQVLTLAGRGSEDIVKTGVSDTWRD